MQANQPHNFATKGYNDMYGNNNQNMSYGQGGAYQGNTYQNPPTSYQNTGVTYQNPPATHTNVNTTTYSTPDFQTNSNRPPVVSEGGCCNIM
jgi:hypothetical protein